jgi:isopentenyldiphosphate isomerase
MGKDKERLNIVDESGNIIGEESRERIHKDGLLHHEIHVWLYTPNREIIFQHRAKDKDTFPDLLDASVGGHVEIGDSIKETAIKELEEESGLNVKESDIVYITTTKTKNFDEVTGMTNHALREIFAYRFDGDISELVVEEGKSLGFEAWPMATVLNITDKDKTRFIPSIFSEKELYIFKKIDKLI